MVDLYSERRDQKFLLVSSFLFYIATLNQHILAENMPMPCPGPDASPLDIVFFIPTGTITDSDYELLKTFLKSVTDYVYLTPQDPSTGVSISVVNFGLQSEMRVPVEGVMRKEDLETSMTLLIKFSSTEVYAENTTQNLLLRFVDNRPDQKILREGAEHVFIFVINRLFTDSQVWRSKIEQSFNGTSQYDYMNIAIGHELDDEEDIRESASLPRLNNHNYWHLSSFQELVERVGNITWSICTRNLNPVPSFSFTPNVGEEEEEEVDCGDPPWPSYGSVAFTQTTFQSSAIYTCDSGYTSNQTLIRICGITGKWQGETVKCLPFEPVNDTQTTLSPTITSTSPVEKLSSNSKDKRSDDAKIGLVTAPLIAAVCIMAIGGWILMCRKKNDANVEE